MTTFLPLTLFGTDVEGTSLDGAGFTVGLRGTFAAGASAATVRWLSRSNSACIRFHFSGCATNHHMQQYAHCSNCAEGEEHFVDNVVMVVLR